MADNVTIPAAGTGTSTPVIATDDISSVHYQRVKLALGGDGTYSGDLASGAGAVSALTPRVTLASDDPAVTALQIIDDWDESDRAKVNIIVGQAGVAAGSGINGVTVQRVTVATDDTVATDLTAIRTALQIVDDWDETDRAKVNPIAGQAGVAAGSGTTSALTQRVTLATDDAAITALQLIDDIVHSGDAALSKYAAIGAVYDDTSPASVTENQAHALRMSSKRELYGVMRDAAGNERGVDVNYQKRQHVAVADDVVTISGNVALEPIFQPVNVSADGATLISGVANRRIRVINGVLMAVTATKANLKSNNNADVSGPLNLGATGGFQIPHAKVGNFQTIAGQSLTISMSTGVQVGGWLTYVLV